MSVQSFPKTYTLADYNEIETNLQKSQFITAYELPVDKGLVESFGRGTAGNQHDAEGRVYGDFQTSGTSPVAIHGRVRLAVRTKQGRLVSVINELDLDEIRNGASNRTDRYPFPIQKFVTEKGAKRWVGYPFVVTLEIEAESNVTLGTSNSSLKMDGKRGEQTA